MPKFPGFGRRKSTANALEEAHNASAAATPSSGESTFRVFERPGANKSFDGGVKLNRGSRSSISPVPKDDNIFEELKGNRGSATSNTNTVSTTDNSSRLSGASTTPSSTDLHQLQENYASPHDKPFNDIPIPPVPTRAAPAFSLKNHGARTWSFGRGKSTPPLPKGLEDHSHPEEYPNNTSRSRAGTGESHANMALPMKLETNDAGFGGDFSSMFSGFGKRKSAVIAEAETERKTMTQSPDNISAQVSKPLPSYTTNRSNNPSPLHFDRTNEVEPAPHSWGSHASDEELMGNISPRYPPLPIDANAAKRASYIALGSDSNVPTRASYGNMPSVDPGRDSYLGGSQSTVRPQRPERLSSDGLKRSSALSTKRKSTVEKKEPVDEDAKMLRESVYTSRRINEPEKTRSANLEEDNGASSWRGASSVQTTPRAHKVEPVSPKLASPTSEDNLFDQSLASEAGLAMSYTEKPRSPPPQRNLNKVMTPAQFERYKQDQERERLRNGGVVSKEENDDEEEEEDAYEDDEDEAEKQRQVAKQRRKQEAHMAVYRQQMMKVTGEQPSALPTRPGMMASMSTPNLPNIPLGGKSASDEGEEDEEVPLAILAAHGFPNKNRPPSQLSQMNSNPNLRASMAAQMETSGGRTSLPVFARNLPQDPYFGAGLVNPINRESLAFGQAGPGSAHGGSVYGGSSRGSLAPPAGGLVGVIAGEERARAARRGSPNMNNGGFDGSAPPGFPGHLPMPQMHNMQNMGMQPGMQPMMGPMGQPMMPQMLTPGDQAQIQMTQQMQQFMQMQMQFMQMMAGGQSPQQNGGLQPPQASYGRSSTMGNVAPPDFLGQGLGAGMGLRPNSSQQQRTFSMMDSQPRTMSMMDVGGAPWMHPQANGSRGSLAPSINAPGYAPSIAPSERSNVGLPGRYRPVSQIPPVTTPEKPRTSTMSGVMNAGWENKAIPTIRAVPRREADEEDEEEAWAEMKRKKEKKKSLWKSKKDNSGLKEMLTYAN